MDDSLAIDWQSVSLRNDLTILIYHDHRVDDLLPIHCVLSRHVTLLAISWYDLPLCSSVGTLLFAREKGVLLWSIVGFV